MIIFAACSLFLLGGLGYFTIWLLVDRTDKTTQGYADDFAKMKLDLSQMNEIISTWRQKFLDLENELHLRKFDSQVLKEWIDKRDIELNDIKVQFLAAQKISERESKIIELGETLKLITKKK